MDFLNGCIGGMLGTIISHPIDTLKTRVQTQISIKNAIKQRKFYNGIMYPIILVPIEKSFVFGITSITKSYDINSFGSGFIAGFVSTLIVTPMEYLKINMQNDIKINLKKLSIRKAYSGIFPTICRESPGYGVYFVTYDYLNNNHNKEKSLTKNFIFGGITGFTSWLVIYPTDLIKTKIQNINNTQSLTQIIKSVYNTNPNDNTFKKTLNFYKGLNLALMRSIPLHAGVFLGYELSKKYLIY
jgi:solute carrier family 25 carnitine/acylcarnitine transporter 20/29